MLPLLVVLARLSGNCTDFVSCKCEATTLKESSLFDTGLQPNDALISGRADGLSSVGSPVLHCRTIYVSRLVNDLLCG
ncbi:hypothetical protein MPTK1_8g01680 [Marchantia polymorpha subsp. ruderalis]|uniref:Secreted protein n=1 Tax=Marchantia polymorpha TaxID=3197 RepID=A0A2R6WR90_MARPO|nr:hypothetical protein MARPO_0064s0031 [Marchantia polymorpha]BBN18328.1 hypothetical protein Mp_8g01680 [Marchantia polymorpha subsp. ruderalis]|eukprot:PTQ36344.1 hypothetical protein MARPO_0064s0031 [Marchantia polymorpha]